MIGARPRPPGARSASLRARPREPAHPACDAAPRAEGRRAGLDPDPGPQRGEEHRPGSRRRARQRRRAGRDPGHGRRLDGCHGRDRPRATRRATRACGFSRRRLCAEGWTGKVHACHHLAEAATGTHFLFVDADVRLAPHAAAVLAGHAQATGMPAWSAPCRARSCASLGELLTVPTINLLLLGYLPMGFMRLSRDPGSRRGLRPAHARRARGLPCERRPCGDPHAHPRRHPAGAALPPQGLHDGSRAGRRPRLLPDVSRASTRPGTALPRMPMRAWRRRWPCRSGRCFCSAGMCCPSRCCHSPRPCPIVARRRSCRLPPATS